MERFMKYIWKNRLFPRKGIYTTNGEKIEVLNCGTDDCNNENLLRNAIIRIGKRLWSGNVVIHCKSSNWEEEIQKIGNREYENVVLHITAKEDVVHLRQHGEEIHQLHLEYPSEAASEYLNATSANIPPACHTTIPLMEKVKLHGFMSRLLIERIEEKSERIKQLHSKCNNRWEETLFKLLARNFGFGIQSNIFETWAALLDMQALGKHRDNLLQVEAIFFGQAGLLDDETIPTYYREFAKKAEHYNTLQREFDFLRKKFNLKVMDGKSWGGGNATPHIRIARLATLYSKGKATMSSITECNTIGELRTLLQAKPEGYWENHLQFGGTETEVTTLLRDSQLDLLIINTIVPILYTYGKHRHDILLCNKAEEYLHTMQSEQNSIIRRWTQKGLNISCAADSQAIIQLQKAYCNRHNCAECRFAYCYFKDKIGA